MFKFKADKRSYWIGCNSKLGEVIFDPSKQYSISGDDVRLYVVRKKEFAVFKKAIIKDNLSPECKSHEDSYHFTYTKIH